MSTQPDVVVSSLGSGSNGNAFLLESGDRTVLIDAGVPIRTLLKCLTARGIQPADIDAVLLSHEHSDHMKALTSLHRRVSLPVIATRGTLAGIDPASANHGTEIRPLEPFSLGELTVTAVPVEHDAREPVGFHIQVDGVSITVMTDLGQVTDANAEFARKANHLIIESNYDDQMLRNGPYPAHLKRRIRASTGHLSNEHCAEFLCDVLTDRTRSIWLSHLSENNNHPEVALKTTTSLLKDRGHVRDVRALPRYDGTVVTWRSTDKAEIVHQPSLPF